MRLALRLPSVAADGARPSAERRQPPLPAGGGGGSADPPSRCVLGFDLAGAGLQAALLSPFICGAEALGSADVRPGRTTDAAQQRERKPTGKQLLLAAL